MVIINGDFYYRRLTGIERYAQGITNQLDLISKPGEIAVIIPCNAKEKPVFKNIKTIIYKKRKSHIWWQMVTLQKFLLKNKFYTVLDFENTCLPFSPGIVFLHDIYSAIYPNDFKGFRDFIACLYDRWRYSLISKKAKKIVTVSNFSRNEIVRKYNITPDKITVAYGSCEHFRNINPDFSILSDYPSLENGKYYFSLGSLSKRKNIKWIIEYAAKHPESNFAISGTSLSTVKVNELDNEIPKNIILLGYLDDSKVKALMTKCKAFILPSYYEGFGFTPLEALSCGAQIIVAKAASLPEIYGNTAHYIDPFNTDVDLDALLKEPVEKPDAILAKYSYHDSAEKVYNLIKEFTQ